MSSYITLDISGFHGNPVPNTFIRQDDISSHLSVLLPGFGYQVTMPVLYYPGCVLMNQGADLLQLEYSYSQNPRFLNAPAAEREQWLSDDVSAALGVGLSQRTYSQVTLIGKSLGTLAMGHVLESDEWIKDANCIWLTPLLKSEWLLNQITRFSPRSLFVSGTADSHYHGQNLEKVMEATQGESVVIPGADHGLEITGDIIGTIDAMRLVVQKSKILYRSDVRALSKLTALFDAIPLSNLLAIPIHVSSCMIYSLVEGVASERARRNSY